MDARQVLHLERHRPSIGNQRPPRNSILGATESVPARYSGRFRSALLLLPVSQGHPLVLHGESVTFDGAEGRARPLPLHRKFWTLARVGGFDLNGSVATCQEHLAAASAIGIDAEAAGVDGHRVALVLQGARHLLTVNTHQGVRSDGIVVGGRGRDGFGVSSDLRLLLAPDPDHYHEQGQQAQLKEMPRGLPLFAIRFDLLWFHGGSLPPCPGISELIMLAAASKESIVRSLAA